MKKSVILVKKSGVFLSPKKAIFVVLNIFSGAKIDFLPFLKSQKMCFCTFENVKKFVFGLLKMSKNVLLYFLEWTFFVILTHCLAASILNHTEMCFSLMSIQFTPSFKTGSTNFALQPIIQ